MSTERMDGTSSKIVQAGREMFGRYGFSKTTMADIANHAGVARQTVYNAFDTKEAVLRAVIRQSTEEAFEALDAAWAEEDQIEQKMAVYQRIGPLNWFTLMHVAPAWDDVMEGLTLHAATELAETEADWERRATALFADHFKTSEDEMRDVGSFFYSASKNAKYGIDTQAEMESRLATILEATMALLTARGFKTE